MNSSRSRIMVVDDDPGLLKLLVAGLAHCGFDVVCACQGLDAMMQYRANAGEFAAIVTDVDMPRMGGLEFVHAIRDAGFKGRIVIMSGGMSLDQLKAIQDCRVSGFFSKPFDVSLLAAMLSQPKSIEDQV